ncbi:hypothetical protein [Cellulomonas sp. HZM]|uniref:hypothetical protein n=1 Tax=Cellulomonas sp. HZM TaxID=1454010 RepID=UPI000A3F81CC|nr:hypothetical protein [Cellulomonas sp. HZM]
MRWEALFRDLEAQLDEEAAAEARALVPELVRAERAGVELADRWRQAMGRGVRVLVAGGDAVSGELVDCAPQWLLLAPSPTRRLLVPSTAVAGIADLGRHVAPPAGTVERRLGLAHALRAIARDRETVTVLTAGHEVSGRLERVGADHVDVVTAAGQGTVQATVQETSQRATRGMGERTGRATVTWSVAFDSLGWVRSG